MSIAAQAAITYLIFLTSYWITVFSIESKFLSNVIKTAIPDHQSHCPKVFLYSETNEKLVQNISTYLESNGTTHILININEQTPEQDKAKADEVKEAIKALYNATLSTQRNCIIMISIVNSTADTIADNSTDEQIQEYKLRYSQQLMGLLQFKTPIQCRKLVLVRLADDERELFTCTKAAKYPRRLVPVWEQILFDFFSPVKVIQGSVSDDEKELKVSQETGHWTWLCQDIIDRLEEEERCQRNRTKQCRAKEEAGDFSNFGNNSVCSNDNNYKPRQ